MILSEEKRQQRHRHLGHNTDSVLHRRNGAFSKCCTKNDILFYLFDVDFWSESLKILPRKKPLEADVVRVAVDRGFVGAGLHLLRLL